MYWGNYLNNEIQILKEKKIFSNKFGTCYNDDVLFPSGIRGSYIRVHIGTGESVTILPITVDNKIIFIKNFRHGVRGWGLEVPKGGTEVGEEILESAKRELMEETGYVGDKWMYIGKYAESPAVFSNLSHCYYAIGCKRFADIKSESTEAIVEVCEMTVEEYFKKSRELDFIDLQTEWIISTYQNSFK